MRSLLLEDDAIRAANVAFYHACELRDLEAMAELWASALSISCIHPGWQPAVGREAVLASWGFLFEGTVPLRFSLKNVQVFVASDADWVVQLAFAASTRYGPACATRAPSGRP